VTAPHFHLFRLPDAIQEQEGILQILQGQKNTVVPEDIGKQAAYMLLEEVQRGGICDSMHQVSDLTCCTLDLAEVRTGCRAS